MPNKLRSLASLVSSFQLAPWQTPKDLHEQVGKGGIHPQNAGLPTSRAVGGRGQVTIKWILPLHNLTCMPLRRRTLLMSRVMKVVSWACVWPQCLCYIYIYIYVNKFVIPRRWVHLGATCGICHMLMKVCVTHVHSSAAHQTSRSVPAVKLLGMMLRNR